MIRRARTSTYGWPTAPTPTSGPSRRASTGNALLSTIGHDHLVIKGLNFARLANAPQDFAAVQVRGGSDHAVVIDSVSVQYAAGAGIGGFATDSDGNPNIANYSN